MIQRHWVTVAAVNGMIAVIAGAFGAHYLRTRLRPELLNAYEVGVRYEMYHALALLAVAWLASRRPGRLINASGVCMTIGIVLFTGSLYALALTGVTKLGLITPFGGLLLIVGWLLMAVAGTKSAPIDAQAAAV